MGMNVLQVALLVGSIWLSVNLTAIAYLALSYLFDRLSARAARRRSLRLVKHQGKLQMPG